MIGTDLAYQPSVSEIDQLGCSIYADWDWQGFDLTIEAISGRLESVMKTDSNPVSGSFQLSRSLGNRLEPVIRYSSINTDGYAVKLSSIIRKTPYSGYDYEKVRSLYVGLSYYLKGNDLKLSAGYEYGKGEKSALPENAGETISGFRVRGQINF